MTFHSPGDRRCMGVADERTSFVLESPGALDLLYPAQTI